MVIFKTVSDLITHIDKTRKSGHKIGFAPTMGALHKGHISLIERAKNDGYFTVCSIFVNPAQFNDQKDFQLYPSTLAQDITLLEYAGCDVLFLPSATEIYPDGSDKAPSYSFGFLETVYEGASRPGHFKGVGKVMAILLQIVKPQALYMGSKDYQQCMVVKDLCAQLGIDKEVNFVPCPTLREADGLAMSSRNLRLNEGQRALAGLLYQCLVSIQSKFLAGDSFDRVQKECMDLLTRKGFTPEYVSIANAETLRPLDVYAPEQPMIALIAASIGGIRLIDNLQVNP